MASTKFRTGTSVKYEPDNILFFAGTLLGLIKTLTFIPGVLSPNLVSIFNTMFGPVDCWYYVFITIAVVYASCGAIYLFLGSGEVQQWNQPEFKEVPIITSKTVEQENGDDPTDDPATC
ncbi:hypothetical protein C0J52_26379 [Blattella germanica]|nr:hypothetical protein C0J52_26379 [Blattella germanica]